MGDNRGFIGLETRAYEAYVHPRNIADVRDIVVGARASGAQVRVRGAMHSEPGSILCDGFSRDGRRRNVVDVMLDRMTDIRDGAAPGVVVVGAGVSMGGDPHAPGHDNPAADPELSLFRFLRNRGRALPITGGISHQTISGFLLTGSAGGSITRSIHDVVVALTLVDGQGTIRRVERADADFPAVLVSLGLLGVVCEVELETVPAFGIHGHRSIQRVGDCDVDLFNDPATAGRWSLREYFERKDVSRILWWPQPGVDRVELWDTRCDAPVPSESERVPQALGVIGPVPQLLARGLYGVLFEGLVPGAGEGYDPTTIEKLITFLGTPLRIGWLSVKLLRDLLSPSSATRIDRAEARALVDALLAVARGHNPFDAAPLDPRGVPVPVAPLDALRALVASLHGLRVPERLIALAVGLFVPLSPSAQSDWVDDDGLVRRYAAQRFLDTWQDGLPMDNPVHDRLLPVQFTELWLPIDRTAAAMTTLAEHFREGRLDATGTFTVEIYAAKRSPAFLSAAFDRDVVRIDPFRYDDGDGAGRARFFDQFYEALRPFEPRFHWGKALSAPYSTTGVAYRRDNCPRWNDFLALREAYDPDDVFLTRYWAEHLGIVPSVAPVVSQQDVALSAS